MPNFISEDQIELAMVQRLQHLCGYDAMNCYTADPDELNDNSGRTDKREVILRDRLKAAAIALNPGFPESAIDEAIKQLCDKRQALAPVAANREVDSLIRDGVRVEFKDEQGRNRKERVKVIDFNAPASPHNQFLAVTQLWIQSTGATPKAGYRRPDILLYVNGLPLVFIELKNSNVKLRTAYEDNLTTDTSAASGKSVSRVAESHDSATAKTSVKRSSSRRADRPVPVLRVVFPEPWGIIAAARFADATGSKNAGNPKWSSFLDAARTYYQQ